MKIKMQKTVRDSMGSAGTVLHSGSIYRAEKARGFIYGICENGQKIPLQEEEWEEVTS